MPYVANAAPTTLTPTVNSRYACAIDIDEGLVLYTKNAADVFAYPASIRKNITMLLICELKGDVLDSETVTWQTSDDLPSIYSQVGFQNGDIVTWRDLLMGGLIVSGGDAMQAAARVLGNEDAGNALTSTAGYERFQDMMNARAAELGMTRSYFTNGHGTDIHRATARDEAVLAGMALAQPVIVSGFALSSYGITVTGVNARTITLTNNSPMKSVSGVLSCKDGALILPNIALETYNLTTLWQSPSGNRVAIATMGTDASVKRYNDHTDMITALPTDFPYLSA